MRAMLSLLCIISLLSSCKRNIDLPAPDKPDNINLGNGSGRWNYQQGDIVLGKQLQNPYTLSNMTSAHQTVTANGINSAFPVDIRATHYYVKFKPTDWTQYDKLQEDTILELYDIPLDYEVTQDGNRYHDSSLPDSIPTYQYGTVKTDYAFDNTIQYEILATLYIPEVDENLNDTADSNDDYIDALHDRAYIQTGNYDDTLKTSVDLQRNPK
jgi:hypothetical protein